MFRKLLALSGVFFSMAAPLLAATVQFSARQDIATGAQHLTGLVIADFNGDGKLDLVITDDYTQKLIVYLNNGTGGFGAPVVTTLNISGIGGLGALVAGDLNGDGKQDLIVAPVAGNQVDVVLLGNGDGTFTQHQLITGSYGFFQAATIDINGDSHLDLVSAANGNTFVALGDGKGNFTSANVVQALGDAYEALTVGDFNGDKHPDFITAGFQTSQLNFFKGNGDGTFAVPTSVVPANTYNPASLASADFNGDGKLDLLVGSGAVGQVVYGNGDGTFQTGAGQVVPLAGVTLPSTPPGVVYYSVNPTFLVATADTDANGSADAVVVNTISNYVDVILNDGTGKFSSTSPAFSGALDAGTGSVQLADLNGDGLPDIVLTNYQTQNVSIFLSTYPKTTPTITVQSSAAQTLVGGSVAVTVQVKGTGSKTPTGTVSLASGSTSYGQQALSSSGSVTFTLTNLAAGQYPLTASYAGDAYNSATANTMAFTQAITDFQMALPTATQTVAAGANTTYAVSLTPIAGFAGTVTLTCSGLPAGYACSPASPNLNGQAATASVVVSPPVMAEFTTPSRSRMVGGVTLCTLVCLFTPWRRRRIGTWALFALVSISVGTLGGCSGSGTSKPTLYTGTSSFVITATTTSGSQSVSHQVTATLMVQ